MGNLLPGERFRNPRRKTRTRIVGVVYAAYGGLFGLYLGVFLGYWPWLSIAGVVVAGMIGWSMECQRADAASSESPLAGRSDSSTKRRSRSAAIELSRPNPHQHKRWS